ncbi:MAG: type II toxin-antitoxin system prevent-host-death family antitoxin [Candidatus Riflebacteria bacterium]|nr:type II toxin-antitoxin system prevent-host-death family antitoxin [Candidatus Riflebacteria bacterium]
MKKRVSTLQVRHQLGDILDRVSLRHDEYIIERKGKPLAAVIPVGKLAQVEAAARTHALDVLARQESNLSEQEAMELADEAKHRTRSAVARVKST